MSAVLLMALAPAVFAAAQAGIPGDARVYEGSAIPPEVDTMYVKGLAYLAKTQKPGGYWDGQYGSEAGVVGLAVLAMLAHGDDPNAGPYSVPIKRGLNYVLQVASPLNGYVGGSMYSHGFATLALAEAYGAVNDARIGPALKKAVDLILTSQARNSRGAWRYAPESGDADTTVSGAQMVALFAARNAGIPVPEQAIEKGLRFFQECRTDDGGFGYTGADGSTGPRAAIGALMFALAKRKDSPEFKSAFRYLLQTQHHDQPYQFYYLYYAAQSFFHADQQAWDTWNKANIKWLRQTQNADGSWNDQQGTVFPTAAALLSLAVNYRLLPIYEK